MEQKTNNCLIIASDDAVIPIYFNPKHYNCERLKDEREALNEIKIKNIDVVVIKGPFEHLEQGELFKIITDRMEYDNKKMIIIEVIEKNNKTFEINRIKYKKSNYILSFEVKDIINFKEIVEL
jgi:hypothetical protein